MHQQLKKPIKRKYNRFVMFTHMDYTILFIMMFLVVFGIIMVYSTSYNMQLAEGDMPPYIKQIVFAVIGFILMYGISVVQVRVMNRFAIIGYVVTIGLLVVVLQFGEVINGSRRWINLGGSPFNRQRLLSLL